MDGNTDISKILGIIMENPDIIDKIRTLAESDASKGKETGDEQAPEPVLKSSESEERVEEAKASVAEDDKKKRRKNLLFAIKPYVSSKRSQAIDTMLTVIDVLDAVKAR